MSYATARTGIAALWASRWQGATVVRWNLNSADAAPSRATTPLWLHLGIEFISESRVAFGEVGAAEYELAGVVAIRALASRGSGETAQLLALDEACAVFRGISVGGLTFHGETMIREPEANEDGAWWVRTSYIHFVQRFRA